MKCLDKIVSYSTRCTFKLNRLLLYYWINLRFFCHNTFFVTTPASGMPESSTSRIGTKTLNSLEASTKLLANLFYVVVNTTTNRNLIMQPNLRRLWMVFAETPIVWPILALVKPQVIRNVICECDILYAGDPRVFIRRCAEYPSTSTANI